MRRGPLAAGEKVQFTDRRSNKITDQLVPGGVTQTSHGIILHDDVIGQTEGSVVVTVSAKREAQVNQTHPERDANKPWKGTRAIGGWEFAVMRPRLADYVLSMPRGAQIMYPKDIAQVIQLGAEAQVRGGLELFGLGLQREVVPGLQLGDALLVDVKAHYAALFAKFNGQGQAHIAQPDDG